MKKILALLLAFILMLSIVACGSSESSKDDKKKDADTEETGKKDDDEKDKDDKEEKLTEKDIDFDEVTVVDNDECIIKIVDIDPDHDYGFTLKAEFENKSSEKTYMFSVENAAVNGVESDPFFATELEPGKKKKDNISFYDSTLDEIGIVNYTDIKLTFRVYNSDNWDEEDVVYETVHVYPYGEDKAQKFKRKSQSDDIVLVDNEEVTMTVIGYGLNKETGDYEIELYLMNKTDLFLMYSVDESSINDYEIEPYYAETVSAGNCAFSTISFDESDLEESDIEKFEEIELTFRIYDYNDWYADDLLAETYVIEP